MNESKLDLEIKIQINESYIEQLSDCNCLDDTAIISNYHKISVPRRPDFAIEKINQQCSTLHHEYLFEGSETGVKHLRDMFGKVQKRVTL